jgi:hypothetical protein
MSLLPYKPPSPALMELLAVTNRVREDPRLRQALQALVDCLDKIAADPEFNGVWTLYQVHGGHYRGPTWVDALKHAREALAAGDEDPP